MRALNPFTGSFYRETLQMSRMTREMFCLMEGRHVHPSTLYPGGVGTVPTVQLFTDYMVRLMKYVEFMKKVVPLHDDLFDFFYEALPGYEKVGQRRILLGCWGSFNDPECLRLHLQEHGRVGQRDVCHAGRRRRRRSWSPPTWSTSISNIRILLGSSYYDDWQNRRDLRQERSAGQPGGSASSLESDHNSTAAETRLQGNYTWVMSPRWYDKRTGDHLALDTGGGPIARFWSTALAGLVDIGYVKATGQSVKIYLPKTAIAARSRSSNGRFPSGATPSSAIARAPTSRPMPPRPRLYFVEKAFKELHAGRTKTWTDFKVPDEAIGCGFHEAVRGVLSHHVVIRDGKIANYHPYPPTPWNANPRDIYGTPGPYEDAVQNTPIFEENGPDKFKGIDIMRAVRSFDPCLPCGVHMYLGNGKVLETHHSPMFGVQP